jgi:superfamily II DNA or RNA helicase
MAKIHKNAECIRAVADFSKQITAEKFDKATFNAKILKDNLPVKSPKFIELMKTIEALDAEDMKNHNNLFKHVIYTDIRKSNAGAKMIAATLTAYGYSNVYDKSLKLTVKDNPYKNFALLCGVSIYDKPFPVSLKKNILSTMNQRPENIHGKNVRFLILDSSYREGIDVYDIKYYHVIEPLMTVADTKQTIGRATRFCGQKGLAFHTKFGWPLHVFTYDLILNDDELASELVMKHSGLELGKLNFAAELEAISRYGAIDYPLTKNLYISDHEISLSMSPALQNLYTKYRSLQRKSTFDLAHKVPHPLRKQSAGGIKGKRKKGLNMYLDQAPKRSMSFLESRQYIHERFMKYSWNHIKFENKCIEEAVDLSKDTRMIEYTPTQEFVSRYFNHKSANKGLLLWHSVGTGKTCSAIAIASNGFEPHGYTILWVTRHTLKSDIWKNMFDKVCSATIRRRIDKGEKIPRDVKKNPLKYINNWVMPISYKQFTNMLLEKNSIHKMMVKINGTEDPLRKTLVIIDEVHKLYSTDLPSAEKPNLKILKSKIQHSYKISGKNSVRLLLMTATPYTSDAMDLIKIINLMNEKEMPETFEDFKHEYLNSNSMFSDAGAKKYLDMIAGYISYLNRENDARQFAYPVLHNIHVPMSKSNKHVTEELNKKLQKVKDNIKNLDEQLKGIPQRKEMDKKRLLKEQIKILKQEEKDTKKKITKEKHVDDYSQEAAIEFCLQKK